MVETKTTPQKNIFFIITCLDTFLVVNNFLSKILFFFEQLASYFIICQLLFFEHLLGNTCLIVNFFSWGHLKSKRVASQHQELLHWLLLLWRRPDLSLEKWKCESKGVKVNVWKWKFQNCPARSFHGKVKVWNWMCGSESVEVEMWKCRFQNCLARSFPVKAKVWK